MFTGIVAAVGRITEVRPLGDGEAAGVRLRIQAGGLPLAATRLGDSIAIQGACMTAVALHGDSFEVDVSRESLDRTCGLDRPGEVNLEHALRLGDAVEMRARVMQLEEALKLRELDRPGPETVGEGGGPPGP